MEIVTTTLQTIQPTEDVLFQAVSVPGCPSVIWRQGSGIVTLRGISRSQPRARFKVNFGADIAVPATGTVEPLIFAIAINGEAIAASRMTSTPAAAEEFNNVFREIYIDVPSGCCTQLTVKNIGTVATDVNFGASMIVERVA